MRDDEQDHQEAYPALCPALSGIIRLKRLRGRQDRVAEATGLPFRPFALDLNHEDRS